MASAGGGEVVASLLPLSAAQLHIQRRALGVDWVPPWALKGSETSAGREGNWGIENRGNDSSREL